MSLLQMSFSGAVMIAVIIVVRALVINRLPKKIFVLLWGIVLLRLLVPFSIPSMFSAYTFVSRNAPIQEALADIPRNAVVAQIADGQLNLHTDTMADVMDNTRKEETVVMNWEMLWIVGVVLCAGFFVISYLRCYFEFRISLPVSHEYAVGWLDEHPLKRSVRIRQSDQIAAPLTYGILYPVILMPKKTDWSNRQQLQYILLHEYMHICHFDMVWKLVAALVLCIHWFNPMVWAMYILFNRDIELSCDESVVRRLGQTSRSNYARTLLSMEEKRSSLTPLCNNFSKNAIEERITAIMKTKKISIWVLLLSAVMVISIVVPFVTSAETEKKSAETEENTMSTGGESSQNIGGMSDGGIEAPDSVQAAAMRLVGRKYADAEPGIYSNWRIASLEHVYTYDDLNGMTLQIYCMNYEFLANDPETIALAGGMTMDADGWVVPEYADSTYLVFEQGEGTLSYQAFLMENDCFPGDELFTDDLMQVLGNTGAVRESTYTIQCMLEGMLEEMPATLYVGNGFSIYIPDDGWQIYDETLEDPYQMAAVYSSEITVGVAHHVDKTLSDVTADMRAEGYSYDEDSRKMWKLEGEGENQLLLEERIYGQDNDVWVVSSRYQAAYEWGSRLDAIADTFALTADGGQSTMPAGPEESAPINKTALELEDIMNAFYNAYFQGDVDWIKQFLTEDYSYAVEVYEDLEHANEVEITREIKGLGDVDAEGMADSYILSLEFRNPGEDSLTYLTAEFVKQNGEWKISFYGLEK